MNERLGREIARRVCEIAEGSSHLLKVKVASGELTRDQALQQLQKDIENMLAEPSWPALLLERERGFAVRFVLEYGGTFSEIEEAFRRRARDISGTGG